MCYHFAGGVLDGEEQVCGLRERQAERIFTVRRVGRERQLHVVKRCGGRSAIVVGAMGRKVFGSTATRVAAAVGGKKREEGARGRVRQGVAQLSLRIGGVGSDSPKDSAIGREQQQRESVGGIGQAVFVEGDIHLGQHARGGKQPCAVLQRMTVFVGRPSERHIIVSNKGISAGRQRGGSEQVQERVFQRAAQKALRGYTVSVPIPWIRW